MSDATRTAVSHKSTERRFAFQGVPRKAGKPFDTKKVLGRDTSWILQAVENTKAVVAAVKQLPSKSRPACPICRCRENSHFMTAFDYAYSECADCGHLWIREAPTEEIVNGLYSGKPGDANTWHEAVYGVDTGDTQLFNRRVEEIYVSKFAYINKFVRTPGRLFDIGCATGEAVAGARKAGWVASGIESDPHLAQFGRDMGYDIVNEYFDASNADRHLADKDVVTCLNTLEHFYDPLQWCEMVGRNMRKGSHLVIEVPRHPSLSTFANKVLPHLAYRGLCPPDHLHVFTERSTEICFEAARCKPVAVWTFGQDIQDTLTCSWINAGYGNDPFLDEMLQSVPLAQQAFDDAGFANSILVIGVKE